MRRIQVLALCVFVLSIGMGEVFADTKQFTPAQLKFSGKKGVCFTLRDKGEKKGGTVAENMPRVKALNPSWNYSWGTTLAKEQPNLIEFVPMTWSASNIESLKQRLSKDVIPSIKNGKV